MNYRRKSGKRLAGCYALFVLLAVVIFSVLWAGGFFNLFSAPVKKVNGNSSRPAELISANRLRHEIYDRNMSVLAISLRMYSVYVRPLEMKKGQNAVRRLVKILAVDNKKIQRQLRTKRSLIWLKRYISVEDAKKIAALNLGGIYLASERPRLYPRGSTASQVIGFVKAGQGLAGTEFAYDNLLRGDWPMEPANQQASGIDYRGIPAAGAAVVLSLDLKLQSRVEKRLAALIKKNGAQSGMAVLMNADNGEILAMVNLPDYDPNHYWNFSSFNRRNRVASDPVYLGGLAKYFQLAAAVQSGEISGAAGRPNPDARLISPRKMKRLPGGDLLVRKPVWQRVRDGIYLLPYINEPVISIGDERLSQFVRQLGMDQSLNVPAGQS
ncbi:MAG: hypothetical protein GXP59_10255, partial [Deltaproteobacteria bacterium]|nr:hypothetical protein [Deltaproteobacteria bacterium]